MTQMFHEATVLARRQLSPGMVRVTLGGPGMADFASSGAADEYLRLFFPDPETGRLYLPRIENGRWSYPDGREKVCCSTYTVRRHHADQGAVDIDFVLHPGGRASDWARSAQPGMRVTINAPHGLYAPPADTGWQLLLADATGLPALSRILEQTPPEVQSSVFIEVAAAEHQLLLPDHPRASVTWLVSGNAVAPSQLEAILRAHAWPPTPGYVWAAAEQKAVRAIRKHLRNTLNWPAERYCLVGYWIDNGAEWASRWQALPSAVKAEIDAGWDSGRDREAVRDDYEATLEKFGL